MRIRFKFAALTFLVVASCSTVGAAECRNHEVYEHNQVRALYYYALLTEAADTGMLPRWACEVSGQVGLSAPAVYQTDAANTDWNSFAERPVPACADGTPLPCIRPLKGDELQEGMYQWTDIVARFRGLGRHIGVYEPSDGGPAYIVCDSEEWHAFVLVELAAFGLSIDDGDLRQWIVRPMVWVVETTLMIDEALETVTLQKNSELSDAEYPETVTAIRGTRPNRLSQWGATVNELRGKSCVFDLMIEVAGGFMGEGHSSYAVTGHSLGGAVAQHVAQHYSRSGASSEFRAFAFNALGIDAQADAETLQSFFIEGDPVPAAGGIFSRVQAGRSVRYRPPNTPYWTLVAPPGWKRHGLHSVQSALCDCMSGMGTLTVNPRYRR